MKRTSEEVILSEVILVILREVIGSFIVLIGKIFLIFKTQFILIQGGLLKKVRGCNG